MHKRFLNCERRKNSEGLKTVKLDRRAFIGGIADAGIAYALRGDEHKSDIGDTFVFLSDLHVDGGIKGSDHQNRRLEKTVDEILRLSPRPKGVVCFGDIACSYGLSSDYALAKRILDKLENAGIALHFMMGNHDRRSTFFEQYPRCAQHSLVPGRCVSAVDLGFADLVLLDALKGTDDRALNDAGPGTGTLDAEQLKWFENFVANARRTFFVGSHQFADLHIKGASAISRAAQSRYFAGWIHGHDHRWEPSIRVCDWRKNEIKPVLGLPSSGRWGDIGYVIFRVSPRAAVAKLVMQDFYFRAPRPVDKRPAFWDARISDLNGAEVHFPFNQI